MKAFLLICDKNCATYKEVFPLFKQGIVSFGSPVKEYEGTDRKFGNHSWITTFLVPNKKKLVLTATYDPGLYPKYDNYDAIEVSRIKNIPYDYDGVMGVPITILDYDLDNVEIEGCFNRYKEPDPDNGLISGEPAKIKGTNTLFRGPAVNEKAKYFRVLIKKKIEVVSNSDFAQEDIPGWSGVSQEFYDMYYEQGNTGQIEVGWPLPHYIKGGKAVIPYKRVLIRKKQD